MVLEDMGVNQFTQQVQALHQGMLGAGPLVLLVCYGQPVYLPGEMLLGAQVMHPEVMDMVQGVVVEFNALVRPWAVMGPMVLWRSSGSQFNV